MSPKSSQLTPANERSQLTLREQRSHLERRANITRARLLRTIDALDVRRQRVQELGHHAKRLLVPIAVVASGLAAVGLGTVIAIRMLVEHRRQRHFGHRVSKALDSARRARARKRREPLWREMLRRVAVSVVVFVAGELAKRGVRAFINAPMELPPPSPLGPLVPRETALLGAPG